MTTLSGAHGGGVRGAGMVARSRPEQATRMVSLWERFISGSGLTITLTAIVLLALTLPIFDARWVAIPVPIPVTAVLGLALAAYFVLKEELSGKSHAFAFAAGILLMLIAGIAQVPGSDLEARVVALVRDMSGWVQAISTDEVRSGVPQFAVLMTALAWLLGYGGGWLVLKRQQAWPLVLLGAPVLLLVLTNVAGRGGLALMVFMGASALLLIHMSTVRRLVIWRRRRLSFDPFNVLSQSAFMLAFGLAAVLLVSGLPTPRAAPLGGAASVVQRSVDSVQADFNRLFNGLPSRMSFKTLSFNDRLSFRGNPNLTSTLLFTVSGDDGTYWRARTYSEYTGNGWRAPGAEPVAAEELSDANYAQRVETVHYFRISAATDSFFAGGVPVSVSEHAEATVFPEVAWDPLQMRLSEERQFFPTRINLRYTSNGSLSVATPSELRQASTDYPDWALEHYVQVPDSVPYRVAGLAWQLTQEETNVYDKADAIAQYLSSMTYNMDITPPPEGRDGVDYFLFDLRQGYCDYFASAMVVMLRTQGIPARYVLGYASGAYDESRDEHRVLELNYHSWVEVYFSEYGWVPFEPTPATSIAFRGAGNEPISTPTTPRDFGPMGLLDDEEDDEDFVIGDFDFNDEFAGTVPLVIGIIGASVLGMVGFMWYRVWWSLGRLHRPDELYAKMLRLAGASGLRRQPGQTPMEYANALAKEIPENASDIRLIAAAYARRRYAEEPIPLSEVGRAEEAWERVRGALFRRLFRAGPAA